MKTLAACLFICFVCIVIIVSAACGAPPMATPQDAPSQEANAVLVDDGSADSAIVSDVVSDTESEFRAFASLVDEPLECIALTFCPDGCVDVADDVDNCGGCGMRCLLGDYCQDGQCHCTSDEGPQS